MDSFEQFGQIRNLHLNLDRRTGLVHFRFFNSYLDILRAMSCWNTKNGKKHRRQFRVVLHDFSVFKYYIGMNGGEVLGQQVHVDWAFVKNPKGKKGKNEEF